MKMKLFPSIKIGLPVLLAAFTLNFAQAQGDQEAIQITRPVDTFGQKPIPVCLSGFTGEGAEVLKFDLTVQGFSFVTPDAAQYLISGSDAGDVTGNLTDKFAKRVLFSRSYNG